MNLYNLTIIYFVCHLFCQIFHNLANFLKFNHYIRVRLFNRVELRFNSFRNTSIIFQCDKFTKKKTFSTRNLKFQPQTLLPALSPWYYQFFELIYSSSSDHVNNQIFKITPLNSSWRLSFLSLMKDFSWHLQTTSFISTNLTFQLFFPQ